ncbi:MAG: hypothetical protein NC191_02605 [Muribaculaceae bacterium]|nr:hypothetical protein [Muribaculaceae bacterium]
MKIYSTKPVSFGMKIPVKTAIEAASGRFLRDAKIAHPAQLDLLSKLGSIDVRQLYLGEVADGLRNMSHLIRARHPEVASAAERINKECDIINQDRTFLPESEEIIKKQISQMLNGEAKKIGKKFIDISSMTLEELGLDKYANL